MPDLIAQEIIVNMTQIGPTSEYIPAVPVDYHLSPIFDLTPGFGVPLWILIAAALIIILAFRNAQWFRRNMVMKPVSGYLDAFKAGTQEDQQVWLFGKNRSFSMETLRYHDDGVVSYPYMKKLSTWFLGSSMAVGHAGGIKQISVSDNYDRVRDFVSEVALMTVVDKFNKENIPDANGNLQKDSQGRALVIQNYDDYEYFRPLLEQMHPYGIDTPVYLPFDPTKAEKIFPPNRSAGFQGGYMLRKARKLMMDLPDKNWIEKYMILGVAIAYVVISLILTYMYLKG